jgi:hypothetical protein
MPLQEESKVIEMKYAGKAFGKMTETERRLSSYQILIKIHAIRGWTIPASELMDILVSEFQKKLSESYANVNEEEMMYAFRNFEPDLKDWGKALNLSLIDEVMLPYLENRMELSKLEESLKTKTPMIEEKKGLTHEEWEEWLVDIKDYKLEMIPVSAYDYLLRIGKINPTTKDKKEFMNKAMPIYSLTIQDNVRKWDEFIKMKNADKITGEHFDSLVTISKRLIVQNYFQCLKD